MRICLISREYPPETGFGGIATFTRHLAHGLKDLGHDVEVVALAKDKPKMQVDNGINVHRVISPFAADSLETLKLYIPYSCYMLGSTCGLWKKFLELHDEKPFDVVDTPELLAEGLFQAVTKICPLVIRLYTPHSKFIAEQLHNVTPNFDHQFVAMMERIAMVGADVITSPSEDLASFVANDLCYPRTNIQIVRNPIDSNEFQAEGERKFPPDNRLNVLFVGRLEGRKGVDYLIDSIPTILQSHPTTRFIIVGDDTNTAAGQTSVLTDLKRKLERSNSSDSVLFVPRVALSELPAYYRSADICVVPSVYDNSPYTCLEAMSCGRAVVGTASGGTPEYIVNGQSGIIVPSRDSALLADAIIELLNNQSERERLGQNARQRVLKNFQRNEIARQMLDLYKLAQENFSNKQRKLYLKAPQEALFDASTYLSVWDKISYDFLYVHSWRFRIRHRWRKIKQRLACLLEPNRNQIVPAPESTGQ